MDTAIWQSAIEKCQRKALIYARSRLGAYRQDAEDIVQDALLWTWERREDYDPQGGLSLESWILNKVIQRAKDYRREKAIQARQKREGGMPPYEAEPNAETWMVKAEELQRVLAELPKKYHGVAERIYLHGEVPREACLAEGVGYAMWCRWRQILRGDKGWV